jgi:cytochrome c2
MYMKSKAIQLGLVIALALFITACAGDVNGVPEPREAPDSNIAAGRRSIVNYGCGTCHAIPGVPGADAMVAPPLNCFYQRTLVAGRLPNTKENLIKWIQAPQEIEPGTGMPDLGVSREDASHIADYLYNPEPFPQFNKLFVRKCPW